MEKQKFELYLNVINLNLHRLHVTCVYSTSILFSSEFKMPSCKEFLICRYSVYIIIFYIYFNISVIITMELL